MSFEIFDSHTHIYPVKIATKAVDAIGDFYTIKMNGRGTAEDLIAQEAKIGCCRALVSSAATRPDQVAVINRFIAENVAAHPENFVGFGTLHPGLGDKLPEAISDILSGNLRGIKLHPDFQKFSIDADEAMPMYAAAEEANLPILFHSGDKRYSFSNPFRVAKVARRFPRLRIIAAHFGGYSEWENAAKELYTLKNVWYDTSSSLFVLPSEIAASMIRRGGVERFFYASDYPMWTPEDEWKRFSALPLSDAEREAIAGKNLKEFFDAN